MSAVAAVAEVVPGSWVPLQGSSFLQTASLSVVVVVVIVVAVVVVDASLLPLVASPLFPAHFSHRYKKRENMSQSCRDKFGAGSAVAALAGFSFYFVGGFYG